MERLAAADGATKCIRFDFIVFHSVGRCVFPFANVILNKSCAREFPFENANFMRRLIVHSTESASLHELFITQTKVLVCK